MATKAEYKTSSNLSGGAFFTQLIATGIFGYIAYSYFTTPGQDVLSESWVIISALVAAVFAVASFLLSAGAMRQMLNGYTVLLAMLGLTVFIISVAACAGIYLAIEGAL